MVAASRFLRATLIASCLVLTNLFYGFGQTPMPAHAGLLSSSTGAAISNATGIAVVGNYAFVCANPDNALEVVDITDPTNPIQKATLYSGSGGALLGAPQSIAIAGNYAYITSYSNNALEIVDISNPLAPIHKGKIIDGAGGAILSAPFGVFVLGNYAYVASANGFALEIVDVTNPAAPIHKGNLATGLGNASCVYVVGRYAYVTDSGTGASGFRVIDVIDPANPVLVASLGNGVNGALLSQPTGINIIGNYAYVVSYLSNALQIIDISNPLAPSPLGSLTHGNGGALLKNPKGIAVSGNYAYITSNSSSALEIVNIADPANPFHVTTYPNITATTPTINAPIGVAVVGNYAYITANVGLEILSLITPAAPTVTGASSVTSSSFTFSWNGFQNTTGYLVDVSTDNFSTFVTGYNGVSQTATSITVSGLSSSTSYQYRVRASNSNGASTNSNIGAALTYPSAPVLSDPTSITQTGFIANWNAVAGATGYYLTVTDVASNPVAAYNNIGVGTVTSFQISTLTQDKFYFYSVKAGNASGASSVAVSSAVSLIPANPTITQPSLVFSNQVSVSVNISPVATAYYADLATDLGFTNILSGYNNVQVFGSLFQATTGITANTTYYCRARAANASGTSGNSNTLIILTLPDPPVAGSATSITQTSFIANWSATPGATGYVLDVSTDPSFGSFLPGFNAQPVTTLNASVVGLAAGTTYHYRVRATTAAGPSSNSFTTDVLTVSATPVATVTAITQSSFTVNWSAIASAGYFVDVKNSDGTFVTGYNNVSVPSATSLLVNNGIVPGTVYLINVRSANASGISGNSNNLKLVTIPATPVAGPADDGPTQSTFVAKWTAVASATGYYLNVATDANFGINILSTYSKKDVGNTNSITVNGLTAGTTYYYQVSATDASGDSPFSAGIATTTSSAFSADIPFPTGGAVGDYRIMSIPEGATATTTLTEASYQTSWRVMHYQNDVNVDVHDVGSIAVGNGYWINSNLNPAPVMHVAGNFAAHDFTLILKPGWNQVGNPFTFGLSWSDVIAKNSSVVGIDKIGDLYTYNVPTVSASSPFQKYNGLLANSGGFVNNTNTSDIQLTIPVSVTHVNGRVTATGIHDIQSQDLSAREWFVPITLQVGDQVNALGGIGMHPDASTSMDKFDAVALPHFFTYVDFISNHPEFFEPLFIRDVVATAATKDWTFHLSTSQEEKNGAILWDNTVWANGSASLFLFDPGNNIIVDMKKSNNYSFRITSDHTIKFFYGATSDVAPDVSAVGLPYPNPFDRQTTIPFITSAQNESVQIALYDISGKRIKTLAADNLAPGYHETYWDGSDDRGDRVAQGMYIYRFISSNSVVKNGKIILK